jgi:hypothetical protein
MRPEKTRACTDSLIHTISNRARILQGLPLPTISTFGLVGSFATSLLAYALSSLLIQIVSLPSIRASNLWQNAPWSDTSSFPQSVAGLGVLGETVRWTILISHLIRLPILWRAFFRMLHLVLSVQE